MKELKIELVSWDYTCGDGCCYDYGTVIKLNGEELEHPDSSKKDYMPNNYVGDDVGLSLRAVLEKLGYNVNIEKTFDE